LEHVKISLDELRGFLGKNSKKPQVWEQCFRGKGLSRTGDEQSKVRREEGKDSTVRVVGGKSGQERGRQTEGRDSGSSSWGGSDTAGGRITD